MRYQDYKWLADARDTQGAGRSFPLGAVGAPVTTGLYRFHNNSHVEAACNEVGGRAWRLLRTWKCAKHLLASYGL